MKPTILRRSASSAVLLLALSALAGCGGGDDGGTASDDPSSDATSQSTSSATSDPSSEPADPEESSAPAAGDEIETSEFIDAYSAALDKATTAHIGMDITGGSTPVAIDGEADFTSTPPSFEMMIDDPTTGETQTIVLADGSIYVPSAKGRYYKTDLADSPLGGSGVDFLDPEAAVEVLEKGITSASLSPDEDVDGETFDHYTLSVDSQVLLDSSGATDVPETGIPDSIEYEVYIDGDGLLRRVTVSDLGPAGSADVTYDQWGEPVDIQVPDKSLVDELPGG